MPLDATWRKSTRSSTNGSCVEVRLIEGTVEVRDTKLGNESPTLPFGASHWAGFAAAVRAGQFDR